MEVEQVKGVEEGCWDSNNIIKVTFKENDHSSDIDVDYNLTTTIIVSLNLKKVICGEVKLSGSITQNVI
ncbi:hypothetical protein GW796_11025 [archaeon]|nr:hypothetical protein [archaeon]NCQ52391.1 hypothetical protein [archaeon]